jgi:hypothetical protein
LFGAALNKTSARPRLSSAEASVEALRSSSIYGAIL